MIGAIAIQRKDRRYSQIQDPSVWGKPNSHILIPVLSHGLFVFSEDAGRLLVEIFWPWWVTVSLLQLLNWQCNLIRNELMQISAIREMEGFETSSMAWPYCFSFTSRFYSSSIPLALSIDCYWNTYDISNSVHSIVTENWLSVLPRKETKKARIRLLVPLHGMFLPVLFDPVDFCSPYATHFTKKHFPICMYEIPVGEKASRKE